MQVRSIRLWARIAGAICVAGLVTWLAIGRSSKAQSPVPVATEDTGVYTTAHSSVSQAIREFFGIRPTSVQPIAFTHKIHVSIPNSLPCTFCHVGVDQGPDAKIPGVTICMTCHVAIDPTNPEIQKIAAYQAKGQDIPWERVYGFEQSAHVKFNHAPHIRAGIDCSSCHGDMTKQTVAVKSVNLTMGYCISCHVQKKVSIDCVTCHY